MRIRHVAVVALAVFAGACGDQIPTRPLSRPAPLFDLGGTRPAVVISQVYGGGGNSGATLRNDFVELLNTSSAAVNLTGWSVQYASAAGTTWQVTNLTGIIQPGAYYLVQEAQGSGGSTNLPTPDAVGAIPMAAGSGKVTLLSSTTALTGQCPTGTALVDQVLYGTTTPTTCGFGAAPLLTNTTAAIRKDAGCTYTGDQAGDFASGAPTPRNSASPTHACPAVVVGPPATVTVAPASATVTAGGTVTFTAAAFDAANLQIPGATFTWSSSVAAVATVTSAGVVTAVAPGDAVITAKTANDVAGTATLHVDAPIGPPATRLSELHYDNAGNDVFEAIEVEGPAGTDLTGWSVVLYNGAASSRAVYGTTPLSGTIPSMCDGRGVVAVRYPANGIQNGNPDGVALVDGTGGVVEFLSYGGTFTASGGAANGLVSTDIGVTESNATPIGWSLSRNAAGTWLAPAKATIGACNSGVGPAAPVVYAFAFSGRVATDPALPVGFQDQLFATVLASTGDTVKTPVTWSSDTPAIASIDGDGVMTALAAGTAVLRATTADGTGTSSYALPTRVAAASLTAQYAGNTEFGVPTDADPSDDILVTRAQYTASFSAARGTPNWVSYDLDATHFGAEDRCDCFTFDPELPASLTRYTTADYTGAGAAAGYQIDRGHLARSFDRTSGSLDNATTFYFTNIVPQAADLNQGPWSNMEMFLGDLARVSNKEVYIVAGVAGSKGTVKNEGLITIPAKLWKVAVILPRDHGLADVHSYQDVQVLAAIMPNDPGVANVDWHAYLTTVDAIEALTGYDLLALLPDQVEIAVESNTAPPTAALDGPFSSFEGSPVAMSGAASSDPDGDALTFAWSFGDGASASGATVTHRYAQNGTYSVRLVVTDPRGLVDTALSTATVANVAPNVGPFAGATLLPGETYEAGGSFTDPGADPWSATVDYGDGSGEGALPLTGMAFALSHTYAAAGSFTVTVRVTDDVTTSSRTQTVTVITYAQGAQFALDLVAQLFGAGRLDRGNANSLASKLDAAKRQIDRENRTPAANELGALLNELDALSRSGRLREADAASLRTLVTRLIASLSA